MNRVILSAVASGSGKTLITCGILKTLRDRGLRVKAYKCGPDYIDPMFHTRVLGIPSENLDPFFSDTDDINHLLSLADWADMSLIEGAMGIYDGIAGMGSTGSAYDVAVKTSTPIILIVDVKGMGNTMVSVIKGILADDEHKLIKGVIINRVSPRFYETIAPVIESSTGVKVLGYLGRLADIDIKSRHLGLKLPGEIQELEQQVEIVSKSLKQTVSIDDVLEIAKTAGEINLMKEHEDIIANHDGLKLAVAYDEVFCFYYENNIRLLREEGIELVYFSPLHDKKLPDGISGILIGGGYPELRLQELEDNTSMRESIRKAIDARMPSVAECGGFMYLHDSIEADGKSYNMVGAIEGSCFNTGRLCRFGYVDVAFADYRIKAHEFHYFDSTNNGIAAVATKPGNGRWYEFGHYENGKIWGFPHLYYGSCRQLVTDFVDSMKKYQECRFNG